MRISSPLSTLTLASLAFGLACTRYEPGIRGTQSLRVELVAPADGGNPNQPLPESLESVQIQLTALDEQGNVDSDFSAPVQVYAQFLATVTPEVGTTPLATIMVVNGVAAPSTVELPPVFGRTVLWVEDGARADGSEPTFVVGTSPPLWFRDPLTADISRPADEAALNALSNSPLEGKQVSVSGSRYGSMGKLLVTSIYAQGYTVSDADCTESPCVTGDYDHILVYTFSRPRDEIGRSIEVGQAISGYGGGVTEFNGLTELSFPQTEVDGDKDVDLARLPAPRSVARSWFATPIEFERIESGLVAIENAIVCDLDDDWTTYKQWKVALADGDCGGNNVLNIISTGITEVDPAALVGQTLTRVVGTLRPVNLGSFNVWIVFPRSAADVAP